MDAISVVSTPHPEHAYLNPQALELKARHGERVYPFRDLDHSEPIAQGGPTTDRADQVAVQQNLGCDGTRMMEAKQAVRKRLATTIEGMGHDAGEIRRIARVVARSIPPEQVKEVDYDQDPRLLRLAHRPNGEDGPGR
jgi:hypothetical protein